MTHDEVASLIFNTLIPEIQIAIKRGATPTPITGEKSGRKGKYGIRSRWYATGEKK